MNILGIIKLTVITSISGICLYLTFKALSVDGKESLKEVLAYFVFMI